MNPHKFFNIFLRVCTLLGKLFFFLIIAKYYDPSKIGILGLIMATVVFSIYFVGLEFFTFSTRELLKIKVIKWGYYLKSQFLLHIILYFLSFPILISLFIFQLLPWEYVIFFFLILFFENIILELSRILITLNQQIQSSIITFFRSGLWCIVGSIVIIIFDELITLKVLLSIWFLCLLISLSMAFYFLLNKNIKNWRKDVDFNWILRGVKVAIPLLIASLVIRFIFTIDRYWIEYLTNTEILGVYVLFIGFVTSIMTVMDAGVFSFSYPNLIRFYNTNNTKKFNRESSHLKKNTIVVSLICIIGALIIIKPILLFIDKQIYYENISIFYSLLILMLIYVLSMIPHYLLYAQRHDKKIIHCHLIALLIFVVSTFIISKYNPYYAVIGGLNLSFLFILIYKIRACLNKA